MARKYNSKRSKKIRNLVAICSLCAIMLAVSTYAWFIGMKTVNVSSFDVEIATTEGLYLSMDGINWTYNLDAKNTPAYAANTNQWLDGDKEGLIPMSSVGDMDADASRMKLFEKASLTASTGGMRLLASRVNNFKNAEGQLMKGDGYVAFDLFIKNVSGEEYFFDNEPLNEEAIYLTTNSAVTVSNNGGVENTGIENSVRVGFAQIGRVIGTSENQKTITEITCAGSGAEAANDENKVTGICREAQIWEPNDTKHVANAIKWYEKSCKARKTDGTSVIDAASYDEEGACTTVADNAANHTYAIANPLTIEGNTHSNVNIYDGLNGYTANTTSFADYRKAADRSTAKLVDFEYFTDTMKMEKANARPTFMTLAPNSITKVRVYIWLEGQDVDNYDFAQLGSKISVNFGFTKERYEQSDFPEYNGPDVPETTNTPAPTTTPGE